MKRHKDANLNGYDEIDILEFASKLFRYWKRIVIAGLFGAVAAFLYFSSSTPSPHSEITFEIGFKNISTGKYPDNTVFSKNDIIGDSLIAAAMGKVPQISDSGKWTKSSLKGALSVSPIYPMDVQMAHDNLSKSGKLKPEEVVANYDKVMNFFPKQYKVTFTPSPVMPRQTQEKFLDALLDQYKAFIIANRLPVFLNNNVNTKSLIDENAYSTAYLYFQTTLSNINRLIETLSTANAGTASNFSTIKMGIDNLAKLESAQAAQSEIERLILDEKALPDMLSYQHSLESDIKRLEGTISMKQKQADFKLKLAELPRDPKMAGTMNKTLEGTDGSGRSTPAAQSMMDLLLTFNKEYYALMKDADTIFREQTALENELKSVRERLARAQLPYRGNASKEERLAELKASIEKASIVIADLVKEFQTNIEAAYVNSEPPVVNSFTSYITESVSLKKVALVGFFFAFMAALGQAAAIVIESRNEKQRVPEQQISPLHPGTKISSKN